jgi:transcriptional antiterminator NusG
MSDIDTNDTPTDMDTDDEVVAGTDAPEPTNGAVDAEPEAAEPEAAEPVAAEPEAEEQVAAEPVAAEPEAEEQVAAEPEAEPVAADEPVAEGDAAAAEAGAVAAEPEAAEPEAEEPVAVAEGDAAAAEADAVAAEPGPEAQPVAAGGESAEVVSDDDLLEQQAVIDNPYTRPGRWFVVHTQSGYEKKVKQNLEARIHSMNAEEAVYEVVIPMEDYADFKNGKRVVAQRKMFPGYLLVRAELDDTAWFVIRNTPGVTGFVGQGAKPSPLPRRDVEAFLMPKGTEEQVASRAKPRLEYEIGETVRVREGPFADFSGEVIEINEDQLKLKVLVNIFGRETPVELEFSKVAKL